MHMLNFLTKKQKSSDGNTNNLPDTKHDVIKQYTLTNPHKMLLDYNVFSWCENMPVKYETERGNGWTPCVMLPTQVFLGYLNALERAPERIVSNPKFRTVFVVNLKNDRKLFILPNLRSPKQPVYAYEPGELAFHVTPEINRAIAAAVKTYTR